MDGETKKHRKWKFLSTIVEVSEVVVMIYQPQYNSHCRFLMTSGEIKCSPSLNSHWFKYFRQWCWKS